MIENKPSYFAVLPAKIRYADDLSSSQILMFAEVTALSNKDGYCSASNTYFAKLYGVDPSTVSKWITGLKKGGYINVHYEKENEQIKSRKIQPLYDHRGIEINQEGIEKTESGVLNKSQEGIEKTAKNNSTSNNNTSSNNNITHNGAREGQQNELIKHELCEFIENNCPEIQRIKKQMDSQQAARLQNEFPNELIYDKIEALENKKGQYKDYNSVYLTLRKWCRMEIERNPKKYSKNDRQQKTRRSAESTEAAFRFDLDDVET